MVFNITCDRTNIRKWAYFFTVHNGFNTFISSFCYSCRIFMHSQNFQHFIPWQIHPGSLLSLHFGLISAHLFLFIQVTDANFQKAW